MFEHVLVAVDFSSAWPRLRQRLLALRALGAQRATLAYVMSTRYPAAPQLQHREHYEKRLAEAAEALVADGLSVDCLIETGEPGQQLVHMAQRVEADLLLLADRGHGKVHEFLIGSTAMDAARLTTLPLWLEPMGAEPGTGRDILLLATDGSEAARDAERWLGQLMPDYQRAVAVTACGAGTGSEQEINAAREHLETLAEKFEGLEVQVESGEPADVVVSLAHSLPADLTVVGKRGRNAMAELLLGSTAETVCRRVQRPVLLVPAMVE
ncbi:MAG: universal stress protein [Wenzhouxiangella sp.]|nr:MAG: universal stress protein [Wenzhouxiangella sp.]